MKGVNGLFECGGEGLGFAVVEQNGLDEGLEGANFVLNT